LENLALVKRTGPFWYFYDKVPIFSFRFPILSQMTFNVLSHYGLKITLMLSPMEFKVSMLISIQAECQKKVNQLCPSLVLCCIRSSNFRNGLCLYRGTKVVIGPHFENKNL